MGLDEGKNTSSLAFYYYAQNAMAMIGRSKKIYSCNIHKKHGFAFPSNVFSNPSTFRNSFLTAGIPGGGEGGEGEVGRGRGRGSGGGTHYVEVYGNAR